MSNQRTDLLRKNFLFRELDEAELTRLADVCAEETHPAGKAIVSEGETGHELYLVLKGGVNIVKGEGQSFLSYIGSGGYFGEMAVFMEAAVRTASCVAAMETITLKLTRATLDSYCEQNPHAGVRVYRAVIKALAERLQATSGDLAMLMKAQIMDQSKIAGVVATKK